MAVGPGAQVTDENGSGPRVEWEHLRALIAGRVPEPVVRRLAYIPAADLAHLRPHLKALRTELRAALKAGAGERTVTGAAADAYGQLAPLYMAGLMCAGAPAEALDWLTSPVLRDAGWLRPDGTAREPDLRRILLALLLEHRDAAWQRDLAGRLAQWLPAAGDPQRWALLDGLAAWSDAAPPASDGYVAGWLRRGSSVRLDHADGRLDVREWFAEQGWRPPVEHRATLLQWLRAQPRLAELVARLFEIDDAGSEFDDDDADRVGAENEWPSALTALTAEGALDRSTLIDLCLAKLLRGDRPGNLRGFLLLAERLAPDLDEIAARTDTYTALAARGAGTVARLAQSALRELDATGRLDTDTLAALSAAVLARPEKSLASAQLSWLDQAVRRDHGAAPDLLRAAATAFAHPAVTVQERAVRLVVRHLKHLGPLETAWLRGAAGGLDAVLRDEAVLVLGGDGAAHADPDRDTRDAADLLPVYQPPAAPVPLATPDELAGVFAAVLAAPDPDPVDLERALDALVAEHERDPHALADAFAPLADRFPADAMEAWDQRQVGGALRCLLHAVLGEDRRAVVVMDELYGGGEPRDAGPEWVLLYRIYELVEHLGRTRVPCLLAAPTLPGGAIDPDALRLRLERYERTGAAPLPCDLEQALLRVPPEEAQRILADSPLLRTEAGRELGLLFARGDGGLPLFERFVIRRGDLARGVMKVPRIAPRFSPAHELLTASDRPPSPLAVLSRLPDPDYAPLFAWNGSSAHAALWPGLLPYHPEPVAAHAVPALYQQANDTARDRNALLPLLAATAGWPGPVTHLALAYGLAAGRPENRAAAVDALLALAARSLLDARALGALCGELWASRMLKPNRLLLSLDAAAQAGAWREVYGAIAAALPALAPQPSVRGLADLLVLAGECARVADLRDELPDLADLAALDKPVRVAAQARRLRRILAGP
jgi:hypothetical protein